MRNCGQTHWKGVETTHRYDDLKALTWLHVGSTKGERKSMKKRCFSRVSNMVNSTLNRQYLRCLEVQCGNETAN